MSAITLELMVAICEAQPCVRLTFSAKTAGLSSCNGSLNLRLLPSKTTLMVMGVSRLDAAASGRAWDAIVVMTVSGDDRGEIPSSDKHLPASDK